MLLSVFVPPPKRSLWKMSATAASRSMAAQVSSRHSSVQAPAVWTARAVYAPIQVPSAAAVLTTAWSRPRSSTCSGGGRREDGAPEGRDRDPDHLRPDASTNSSWDGHPRTAAAGALEDPDDDGNGLGVGKLRIRWGTAPRAPHGPD